MPTTSYLPSFSPSYQPTRSGGGAIDDGVTNPWIRNSAAYSISNTVSGISENQNLFYTLCWVNVGVSLFVLAHSYLLHEFTYTSVRLQTDLGALFSIGSVVAITLAMKNPTRYQWALLGDLCYGYLFPAVIQLCDNYMFYSRLMLVANLPRWHRYCLHGYIWIVITATWLPANTLVPFFYNTNSTDFQRIYDITLIISCWGHVAYNFYFTFHFLVILQRIFKQTGVVGGPSLVGVTSTGDTGTGAGGTGVGGGLTDTNLRHNNQHNQHHQARSPLAVLMHNEVTKTIALKVRLRALCWELHCRSISCACWLMTDD